ncbi:MAG: hypothetical protein EXR49_03025 [Dehalococcoidia bacterium]|nr:hypothetical protein [Dehalococcoidia bacterium]
MADADRSGLGAGAQAGDGLERAVAELRQRLAALAQEIDPFPYFLNSDEVQAVEAEPGEGSGADRGCIVVCPDGEMYEFNIKLEDPGMTGYVSVVRWDSVKPVELTPEEYIAYATNALRTLERVAAEQGR